MRALSIVVAVVGLSALAAADIDESRIERARDRELTSDYQDELPSRTGTLRFDLEGGDGTGSGGSGRVVGGRSGSGSGTAAGMGSGSGSGSAGNRADPKKRDAKLGRRGEDVERQDTREYRVRDDDTGPLGSIFTVLMWGLLAVVLALLAFWFVSEFSKSGDDPVLPSDESEKAKVAAQTAAIIEKPLDDADVLAQQGRYVEAIHTLLLRTLHELARSAMVRVERSHTSREILARVPLLADAREALSVLITYVELTHFGDDPATEADYAKCREQFNRFAQAFRAGLAVQQRSPQGGGTAVAA